MSNFLKIYENFDTMNKIGIVLYKSGFFKDAKSEAQAIVKIMAGTELGLPPIASMSGIHVYEGKVTIGSNLIATLIENHPYYDYKVLESTNEICRIEFLRDGTLRGISTFTIKDAARADLLNKPTKPAWQKYPPAMLFARALTQGARLFAAGVFGGSAVYTPEELGADTDEEENIIEGETINTGIQSETELVKDTPEVPTEPITPVLTLEEEQALRDKFGMLMQKKGISNDIKERWMDKAGILNIYQLPPNLMEKCIIYMESLPDLDITPQPIGENENAV
jgi:hypothetical protein